MSVSDAASDIPMTPRVNPIPESEWDEETAAFVKQTWNQLAAEYDVEQLIEVPMLVGQYQMVTYLTNSLGMEPDPALPRFPK